MSKKTGLKGASCSSLSGYSEQNPAIALQASGWIRDLCDVQLLRAMGVRGAMIGKAFYEQTISLKELSS
ncbi:HisA/HisF-related TIM barrel protein [Pajaroellobacter abortibovis]|uniref:Indole-3-glycerol-phosphate synthase n=1 Tax=Pajaroellobacter abortibovis TaxID=1882918 RepID=A0A1L6MZ90_9BACT|nr:HisA/HisF-related TIM barrel protein [Pajaroellobacter abortibovis]APS00725.1 hypothetical protein BCY86_08580 [Pajaroellobacter abortibovis]